MFKVACFVLMTLFWAGGFGLFYAQPEREFGCEIICVVMTVLSAWAVTDELQRKNNS